jgi:hypothetical protein
MYANAKDSWLKDTMLMFLCNSLTTLLTYQDYVGAYNAALLPDSA